MSGVRRLTRFVAVGVLLALLPFHPATASHGNRLEQTRREIRATRARLNAVLRTDAEVRQALAVVNRQLARQQVSLAAARSALAKIDLRIRAEERRLTRLSDQERKRKAVIAQRARALYIMGPGNSIEALTNSQTIEEFVGRAGALEQVMSFDKGWLEELAAIKDEARKARAALKVKRAEAVKAKEDVAERVSLVAEIAEAKEEAHAHLSGKISAYRNQIAALQREQNRILAIIRSRQSTSSGPVSRRGFAWPIRGMITSPYGPRWGGFHTGMDIDCRTGDPIGASKAGRVIAAEWGGGYGNMVIIDHGNGVSTLYAHNSRLFVRRGERVSQRERIAACGTTGNSTGDHLHFEIRINGRHTNPRPYLS